MADVVIVGAGPAGLSAALDAAEAGHDCTLVEVQTSVGGMAGSFELAGQRVDYGSHRLHRAISPRLLERFQTLLGEDLQVRPRNGRIRLRGRWVGFPLRAGNLVANLPPSFGLRVAADLATGPLRRRRDTSFESDIRVRLGPTVAREFYNPYALKLYGVEAAALDAELAHRRVSASSGMDIVRRVVRAARPVGRQFLYPRHGYGQLSEALAEAAVRAGVDVRLNTAVTGIGLDADRAIVSIQSPSAPRTADTLGANAVFSTVPVSVLASVIRPPPPGEVMEALARCRTRAMVLVYLVVRRDQYTPFDAHYFPDSSSRVARLSESKNYRDGDDPRGQTVLCAEIACWPYDDLWRCNDDRLAEIVSDDLERAGLPPVDPSMTAVKRLRSVYPVFESATTADRARVSAWLQSLAVGGLMSFGRQGLAVLDNLHHVLDMGSAAVTALTGTGMVNEDAWKSSLDAFLTHVVED
ncbi:protoporphyrinogen/coproporphyrinogen oxidase [Candidatus Poriferisodalis sp.]|uniref:protoporphyrinogen/coproporphyrinogen oxidase n=1 Tax=Candidatus Poriferisodalis sp. TaxID=3101277 RepID=UPI003B5C5B3F